MLKIGDNRYADFRAEKHCGRGIMSNGLIHAPTGPKRTPGAGVVQGIDPEAHPEHQIKYTVPVRALCEFTAKEGDLDLRFTPTPSAQEGIAGHGVVTSRRPANYQREVSLAGEYKHLLIRGRVDGFDPVQNQVEEIKTFRGDLGAMPDNHRQLHWAQVKIYGWLLCQKLDLSEIRLALIYFDIVSKKETWLSETHDVGSLKQYFESRCECFLNWAEQELAHRTMRNEALNSLRFPHPSFRQGQRPLAEAVYKTASAGRCLIAQAPTGIGKTIGTLFPLLKACPRQELDKIFYLTAKTSGRKLALDALTLIKNKEPALALRVLELVARDKACEHPDKACHGDSCPLASGFYDRLPAARTAALAIGSINGGDGAVLNKDALRAVASEHQVCPYYLGQDLVRWCDVVVGDYNHYFDLSALLYGLASANQWRVTVLVDEAHNLLERGRKMYSAELDQAAFKAMRRSAPMALKKILDRVNRRWNELHKDQEHAYRVYSALPAKFLTELQQAITAITDYLTNNPTGINRELQRFYFDALHFCRVSELFDEHSLFDITKVTRNPEKSSVNSVVKKNRSCAVLCLRNIIPGPLLAPRFAAAQSTALFSATLTPWRFYGNTLGLPENAAWIDVESPFKAEQLSVRIVSDISTRYQHRERSVSPIADLIAGQYKTMPGNYLAFFSSFDYLQMVALLFRARYPEIPVWEQTRGMEEAEKADFLARFTPAGHGIGFAVLGGSFAEGVDLPGKRLTGAFIATLGLAQINPVNEQIKQRMDAAFKAGHDYTYLFPGIQKVVQAAGRVIRTHLDQGVIYLIDDRFTRPDVLRLLPAWWKVEQYKTREAR
ncbi:ATP-dependent DNA helicase [Nitrosospira briensis]|uniref:ATP-dependent DNA helicase n=1 Tax=Nitrosospira briensis TaxID=35799 RepID=UPI00210DD232|nr:ATP-dependent DNA helicase [Nitrosospira briensis]